MQKDSSPEKKNVERPKDEPWQKFGSQVRQKELRKARARREGDRSIWLGMGMFGLVGWSISVPTLLGLMIGRWLDARYASDISWTLALMLAGLTLGALNVWHWIGQNSSDDAEDEN